MAKKASKQDGPQGASASVKEGAVALPPSSASVALEGEAQASAPPPETVIRGKRRAPKQPSLPEIEVREMELEDLAAVFHLGERVFTSDRWPNLYRTWDEYEIVGFFMSDGETCFVAEMEGKVVGFILGTMIEKRRSAWAYGYVVWLGVDPGVGRRGIGGRLLRKLHHRFIEMGARIAIVDTAADNKQAIGFFEREGFGQVEDHIYMSMNLTHLPEYQRMKQKERNGAAPKAERGRAPNLLRGRPAASLAGVAARLEADKLALPMLGDEAGALALLEDVAPATKG